MSNSHEKITTMTMMGILTAIVIVLQTMAIGIRLGPFSITLVLVPIVVGAALYGWKAGAWLGFVFGVVVLITDAATFLAINIPGTVITVMLKGMLAGVAAAGVYKLLEKKNVWVATVLAALACQLVNKAIFILGCAVFFLDTVKTWAAGAGAENLAVYMMFGMTGLNFVVETPINLIFSTVIVRVIDYAKKRKAKV